MNMDTVLNSQVFKNMDKDTLNAFKKLSNDIVGKNSAQILTIVADFSKKIKLDKLSKDEKKLLIDTISKSMTPTEEAKFKNVLKMVKII